MREKFIIGATVSSILLLRIDYFARGYGVLPALFLGILSVSIIYWSFYKDTLMRLWLYFFLLPFLYSISWGLFFSVTPIALPLRIVFIAFYAVNLYAVFLVENIFRISFMKYSPNIMLYRAAKSVSLWTSLVSFMLLASAAFSWKLGFVPTVFSVSTFSALFTLHMFWTYSGENSTNDDTMWVIVAGLGLGQLGGVLWAFSASIGAPLLLSSVWYAWIGVWYNLVYARYDTDRFFSLVKEHVVICLLALFFYLISVLRLLPS